MLTAVTSTGIFCRNECAAPPPRPENVIRLATVRDCLAVGCRPCKRCRPLHGAAAPDWLSDLLRTVEANLAEQRPIDPTALRKIGLSKQQLGRWFAKRFDFSFDAYCRMRRLAHQIGTTCFRKEVSENKAGRKKLFRQLLADNQVDIDAPSKNENAASLLVNRVFTPLGPMLTISSEQGICLLEFVDRRMLETNIVRVARRFNTQLRTGVNSHIVQLASELKQYFAGQRTEFTVPLEDGGTEFQNLVWQRLKQIPLGRTTTYSQIAGDLDRPQAVRAVGRANGDNRLSILIPCHRLVGFDGSLTGYGGGLERKQWLLDHEASK